MNSGSVLIYLLRPDYEFYLCKLEFSVMGFVFWITGEGCDKGAGIGGYKNAMHIIPDPTRSAKP